MLEELGTTFIKVGQLLSTRGDLLPSEYRAELSKLQDSVAPMAADMCYRCIAGEMGRPFEEAFSEFDPVPLAAASIGQAHAARLVDGTEVVVKVRRPGAVDQVKVDLEILRSLAANARRLGLASQYDPVEIAREFTEALHEELDYFNERRNAMRVAENFADDPDVHIPRIYKEATTSEIITMERLRGIKITDIDALDDAGIDRKALAQRATRIVFKMVFEDGYFHADPHPGNFFIEPDGRIGLIDFGLVGVLDARSRDQLIDLVLAVYSRDSDRLVDVLQDLDVVRIAVDRGTLRRDLTRLIAHSGGTVGEAVFREAMDIARRHRLVIPGHLSILIKTMLLIEGIGKELDPGFSMGTVTGPLANELLELRYSPLRRRHQTATAGLDTAWLTTELPNRLRRLLGDMERGELGVSLKLAGLEPALSRFERLGNRIVAAIVAAAFLNGLAVLLAVYGPSGWGRWSATLAVGFVVLAVALGGFLALHFIKSRRA